MLSSLCLIFQHYSIRYQLIRIVEHHNDSQYRQAYLLELFWVWIVMLRFTAVLLASVFALQESYWSWDHVARYLLIYRNDPFLIGTFVLFILYVAVFQIDIYGSSRVDTLTWLVFYDVIVRNWVQLEQSRNQVMMMIKGSNFETKQRKATWVGLLVRMVWRRDLRSMAKYLRLDSRQLREYSQKKLKLFPYITVKVKICFLVIDDLVKRTFRVIHVLTGLLIFATFVFYRREFTGSYGYLRIGLIVVDFTAMSYLIFMLQRGVSLMLEIALLARLLYREHYRNIADCLARVPREDRLMTKHGQKMVEFFLYEHHHLSQCLVITNNELWSRLSFYSILANIPLNIYMIYRSIFIQDILLEACITWFGGLVQLIALNLTLYPLAQISQSVRMCKPYLVRLMPLRSLPRIVRWKMFRLFEQLSSGKKLGIHLGPMGCITKKLHFELVLGYIAYLLFVFNFLRDMGYINRYR